MPKRAWIVAISLILFLILSTQGVVQAKLFQLKVSVSRERLMNFELSSKALQARFREIFKNPDDYRSEIKRNVIESGILNNRVLVDIESGFMENLGIAVVNSIRIMSLKPILHLHRDRKLLLILKYAFFMERSRRLEIAVERYEDVINILQNRKNDILAFSLLHHGYCLASMGRFSPAIQSLEETTNKFPGTHFSRTAAILLNILETRQKLSKRIEEKNLSSLQKARSFYQAGLYGKACEIYEKERNTKGYDKYRWGRCSEEIGKQKRALRIYKELAKSKGGGEFPRLANRRLLVLGNFYHAGKDVIKIASQNAVRLNDSGALKEISEVAKEQREAVVVQEIITGLKEVKLEVSDNFSTDIDTKSLLKEIGSELVQNVAVKKETRKELELRVAELEIDIPKESKEAEQEKQNTEESIEKLAQEKEELTVKTTKLEPPKKEKESIKEEEPEAAPPPVAKKRPPLPSYIRVLLVDGRSFSAQKLEWDDGRVKLGGSKSIITHVPISNLKSIRARRDRRRGERAQPAYMEVNLENGEDIKTRFASISVNGIQIKGKVYDFEDVEEIEVLP